MQKWIALCLMMLCIFCLYAEEKKDPATAETKETSTQPTTTEPAPESPNLGNLTINFGIDWTTQYMFRGLVNEDQGWIAQPYVELGIHLYQGEALSSVDLLFGTWGSLHGNALNSGSTAVDPEIWYEQDFYVVLSLAFWEKLTFSTTYSIYTSPNDSFHSYEEVSFKLGWNDEGVFGDFTFSPYILLALETDDSIEGGKEGAYFELGITPSYVWKITGGDDYSLCFSLPMKIGFALDDYYDFEGAPEQNGFAFADFGISIAMPLSFIPPKYGAWQMAARVNFILLDRDVAEFNSPVGDDVEVIGTLGLSANY